MANAESHASRKLAIAFGAVYLFWGSTFLAIRFGVQTIPPLLMTGTRHLIAGLCFTPLRDYAARRSRNLRIGCRPCVWERCSCCVEKALFPHRARAAFERGGAARCYRVSVDDYRGMAAPWRTRSDVSRGLLSGAWIFRRGNIGESAHAVRARGPSHGKSCRRGNACGWFAHVGERVYSVASYQASPSPLLGTAMFALTGGTLLWVVGLAAGEGADLDLHRITTRSYLAVAYLAVFGSIIGLSAYTYMLKNAPASRVSTYAFVNPVIAVFLGWLVAGEKITSRMLVAAAIILPLWCW